MILFTLILVAVALGTDAFAVAIGIGIQGISKKQILILSGTVCFFHIFMPLAGLAVGSYLGKVIGNFASIVGSLILLIVGINMVKENLFLGKQAFSLREFAQQNRKVKEQLTDVKNPSHGLLNLLLLCTSVSLDAFGVGISLGVYRYFVPVTVAIIGLTAGLMTAGGLVLGQKCGLLFGEKTEMIGGFILIIIGIKLLM